VNDVSAIAARFSVVAPFLDERQRRLLAAAEARALGPRAISAVARATGLSRDVIARGLKELMNPEMLPEGRVRRPGAGRKPLTTSDPGLADALESLVDPVTRGDPESPLRWTAKSLRRLAAELTASGHRVSPQTVAEILASKGYSLQANAKTLEGRQHPDRDAQFRYINDFARDQMALEQPVISVDAKKKELVGPFRNGGREYQPKGTPEEVRVHDFLDETLGKVTPYGVFDIARNEAWVSVGTDHDTAAFAVASVQRWWEVMGRAAYPNASTLMITADCGGSNGYRLRLWKTELQRLANALDLAIIVCHLPPGTSKWNKIEHRLFSFITQNWRGRPLVSHEVIVNLIAATTTRAGLHVRSAIDSAPYPKGVPPSQEDYDSTFLVRHEFHGEWNYTVQPRSADGE
jgi:hypothetical protein